MVWCVWSEGSECGLDVEEGLLWGDSVGAAWGDELGLWCWFVGLGLGSPEGCWERVDVLAGFDAVGCLEHGCDAF